MAEGFGHKDHSLDDAGGWITHTDNTSAGARPYTHGWILHIWVWDVKKKKPEGRVWGLYRVNGWGAEGTRSLAWKRAPVTQP